MEKITFSFKEIDAYQDIFVFSTKSNPNKKFFIVGKFVGFDGEEYVAIKNTRWGDKTFLTLKNFKRIYQMEEIS